MIKRKQIQFDIPSVVSRMDGLKRYFGNMPADKIPDYTTNNEAFDAIQKLVNRSEAEIVNYYLPFYYKEINYTIKM